MKSRILHSSYVIDFLDIDFNSDEISKVLKLEADKLLEGIAIEKLKGWEICFNAIYGKGESMKVFRRLPAYIEDKQKYITISIPVPSKDIVPWGVNPNQLVEVGRNAPQSKNVTVLDIKFKDFENRTNYITYCIRRAINLCFYEGFTVNGEKVKIGKINGSGLN